MNINQKAIEFLEANEYDAALALFKQAVNESRDVQSLTNLAWIYYHEECDKEAALEIAQEAISLNSVSYFPYNLCGEIYVEMGKWEEAADVLLKSITIAPSIEAYNNLAIAKYHLGELEETAALFIKSSRPSDYAMYSHIMCLIELGRTDEAKRKLDAFSENDDEFVGEVHVAELYVELHCYSEAVLWFERAWNTWYKTPDWVCRYIYSLIRTGSWDCAVERVNECIQLKVNEIQEEQAEECSDDWTESEKSKYMKQLEAEQHEYENILSRIDSGYVPPLDFTTSLSSSCYLFGCTRHNHLEYTDWQ